MRRRRDDVSAIDQDCAIERDADGLSGAGHARHLRAFRHRPCLDRLDARALASRHDENVVIHAHMAALDPTGEDAAIVELIDGLHRHAQRQIMRLARRREGVERGENRRPAIPGERRCVPGDAVAVACGDRNHGDRCQIQP